jgi:predicted restriction endonuclease
LFDAGLVTIEDDLTLCVSKRVRGLKDEPVALLVAARHGQRIIPPARFFPDTVCL